MTQQSAATKCAHPGCDCDAQPGSRFCGEYCEKAGNMTELQCNCQPTACRVGGGNRLSA